MPYKIKLEPEASTDIQHAIDWYNKKQKGLGKKFYKSVRKSVEGLTIFALYQVRYGGNIRCLPVKNFPYMLHFTVDENQNIVILRAVFHTSKNPSAWLKRK